MKVALVNPSWSFGGSIYFGCREPHLPLELGYSKALLERNGHAARIFDGQLFGLSTADLAAQVLAWRPDMTVLTTAPSYLFWRCAPPELRVPMELVRALDRGAGRLVIVGPHASTTPAATLRKLGADAVVMGECEDIVALLAEREPKDVPSVAFWQDGRPQLNGGVHAAAFADLPALRWPAEWIARHHHHHHRFEAAPGGPGAEVEASRGCPYSCSFCAKENFRDAFRKRDLAILLDEIDGLIAAGAEYVYFIDEIFIPIKPLLEALVERPVKFGIQTRIDLWKPDMIALLGEAGCVSIEAGVESITPEGRKLLDKNCRLSTDELSERLITAKQHVPFVQANLLMSASDDDAAIQAWRANLHRHGVWANDPVPLFPYPGSPEYRKRWGLPDEQAWERAVQHYLSDFSEFSDIQEMAPRPLPDLEAGVRR